MEKARIHSFQSLGTVDGPGVRFVVFMQGCPLRCGCCHNPDTWDAAGGEEFSAEDVFKKAERCREYFGAKGGITVSGGEPLLWPQFVGELFKLCHQNGINTCIDTAGCILNDDVLDMLDYTDRVLLDIKYTSSRQYEKYVGCEYSSVLEFLGVLRDKGIPVTLRQVIIPSLNDTRENILDLKQIASEHDNVDKIELLPFRKLCEAKYQKLGIDFPFAEIEIPSKEKMDELQKILDQ